MHENYDIDQLLELVENKQFRRLMELLSEMNEVDIAEFMDEVPPEKLIVVFRLLPKELAAETFVEMETEDQELLIQGFSDNELKEVLDELYVDDAADLVEEMPANVVKRILRQADPEMRRSINQILQYPENSAGSLMTTAGRSPPSPKDNSNSNGMKSEWRISSAT